MRCGTISILSSFALIYTTMTGIAQEDVAQATQPKPEETNPVAETTSTNGDVMLELNGAAATEGGGCRLTVVTSNRLDQEITRAAWQVAIFDKEGVVQSLPILDFGALIAGKTKIAMFELQDRKCEDIGRIVVNDVAACEGKDGTDLTAACLSGLTTQSRTDIDFGL